MQTDDIKLWQVLINLLDNAIKFTQSGSVSVTVCQNREIINPKSDENLNLSGSQKTLVIYFEIADTGVGILPKELDSIFELFVQTSSGEKV